MLDEAVDLISRYPAFAEKVDARKRATKIAKQQGKHRSHVLPNFVFFEVNVMQAAAKEKP
jgi:hypothetical protein